MIQNSWRIQFWPLQMWILRMQTCMVALLEIKRPDLKTTQKPRLTRLWLLQVNISIAKLVMMHMKSVYHLISDNAFSTITIVCFVFMACAIPIFAILVFLKFYKCGELGTFPSRRRPEGNTENEEIPLSMINSRLSNSILNWVKSLTKAFIHKYYSLLCVLWACQSENISLHFLRKIIWNFDPISGWLNNLNFQSICV